MSAYSYKRYFNTDKFIIVLFNITTPEASINPSFIERGDSQAQKETSTSVSPVTTLYTKAQLQVWREPFWPASRLDLHKSISSPDCPGMQWEPTQEICELYMFLHLVQAFHLQIWPQSLKQLPLIGLALLSYGLFSGKSKYGPQISVNVAQHKPLKLFKTLRDSFKKNSIIWSLSVNFVEAICHNAKRLDMPDRDSSVYLKTSDQPWFQFWSPPITSILHSYKINTIKTSILYILTYRFNTTHFRIPT